ncbi:uncharacterized protein HGUI_00476 [Hanseniaspora guilliermondii]|uniref:Meiotically up-regulated protein Msb1/Mug8 domain-containing protein n=1 Tax=Hanseniaspora guilliermondii TaxID=56406 RepID=A0A1L0AXI6_9ASCO|nr:uncharacterized protein HGUI_00476 [Hanseniaspora guilliermondii]
MNQVQEDNGYEFVNEFYPKNIKKTIHLITQQLKQESALNIDYLFLPFRKEQTNESLLRFLNAIMPRGDGKALENESKLIKIIKKTQPGVLFHALKYIWSRTIIPSNKSSHTKSRWNGVVGYDAYLKFRDLEIEKMYPRKSFLELMPRCLTSPDHASLVYDMFDLISTISSNAPKNKMSCRKISKMCAIWAFDCTSKLGDEDNQKYRTLTTGIQDWIIKAEAMFHLSIAFIRSFAPEDESLDKSNFPISLLHVLKDNKYPPEPSTNKNMLQIPVISLQRHYNNDNNDQKQKLKPWSLIENINQLFKSDDFMILENDSNQIDPINNNKILKLSRQQKALIKSIFSEKSSIETISKKMSKQSKKIMKEFTTRHSSFQAGWNTNPVPSQKVRSDAFKNTSEDYLTWTTCYIDDFYIWTWMSSLSNEESPRQRNIFGRSLILEFEFDAFKKWVIFEEVSVNKQQDVPKVSPRSELRAVSNIDVKQPVSKPQSNAVSKDNQRKVSRDIVPTLQNVESIDESSDHDTSNVSSNYNNKTFLNGYMTNGDITNISAISKPESEKYVLPAVDESAFNIDLPDIDPSQITIDGSHGESYNNKYAVNSSDSITEAIRGLGKELNNVEEHIKPKNLDPFAQSNGSTIKSLQFGDSYQKHSNGRSNSDDVQQVYSDPSTYVPERSPERNRNLSEEEQKPYSSGLVLQNNSNQSSITPINANYPIQRHESPPKDMMNAKSSHQFENNRPRVPVEPMYDNVNEIRQNVQQQYPIQQSPVKSGMQQFPGQHSPVRNTVQQQPVKQQYQAVPVSQPAPVKQQYQPVPVSQPAPVKQQYEAVPVSQPVHSAPIPKAPVPHVQKTSNDFSPTVQSTSNVMMGKQAPVGYPQGPSSVETGYNKPQPKGMPMNGQRPVGQGNPVLPRAYTMQNVNQPQHMKQPSLPVNQIRSAPFQRPMDGGMPRSQSYNKLPGPPKHMAMGNGMAPQQRMGTMQQSQMRMGTMQQPQQMRMGTMQQSQMRMGTMQQPQQMRMGTMQQPPQMRMGTMQNSYSTNNINGMLQNRGPVQPYMGQQIQRANPQGFGNAIMPTTNKHRKQDQKNLQQQLRSGGFGI